MKNDSPKLAGDVILPDLSGARTSPEPDVLHVDEPGSVNRFAIKLHPYLKAALKHRADVRGLDVSGYIQEVLWKHCPEAEDMLTASIAPDRASLQRLVLGMRRTVSLDISTLKNHGQPPS